MHIFSHESNLAYLKGSGGAAQLDATLPSYTTLRHGCLPTEHRGGLVRRQAKERRPGRSPCTIAAIPL
jgi:hypothetical protein